METSSLARRLSVAGTAALFSACVALPLAMAAENEEPALVAGKFEFTQSCSSCHGIGGTGDGPIVPLLKEKPANLTLIAKKNGGEFPFWSTYQMIDGRKPMGGHGSREMPIWGDRFKEASGAGSHGAEAVVRGRILELIAYLQSIQQK